MRYYEVLIADGRYHGSVPLTYSSEDPLPILSVVTVPLRQKNATGFILEEVASPPEFKVKPVKTVVSNEPLPYHCLQLARWMQSYYSSTLAESLRQFAPSRPTIRRKEHKIKVLEPEIVKNLSQPPLTAEQKSAIGNISEVVSTTVLLHGETGSGKTRVYLELAKKTLEAGRSVILLTPEISLTSQLLVNARQYLNSGIYVLHSQLTDAERKRVWFEILEAKQPVVVIGPRSALFTPVNSPGLIILDEAHEPAYKQDQAPYYHAARVASQLGALCGARVVLGSATPSVVDYFIASERNAVIQMTKPAINSDSKVEISVVDLKDRSQFSSSSYLSTVMIDQIKTALTAKQQVMLYLNRRGSARSILCNKCGWHLLCPNCDVSLVYHGDEHLARCHVCGYKQAPPVACPECGNPEIIYKTIGTKTLADEVTRLFPDAAVRRFDSDNAAGEQLHDSYSDLLGEKVDILVGTQLLAKGLDLPRLGLVGVVSAESSLGLPDFTAEERAFQLLYQIIGRVGRGHGDGRVVVQAYDPENLIVKAALERDWRTFYQHTLKERQSYKFPPFSYLLQLTCKRVTKKGAEQASSRLKSQLLGLKLPVEIIGPTPSFYARRGRFFYYQLVVKAKDRNHLIKIAKTVPASWQINIDPSDLL